MKKLLSYILGSFLFSIFIGQNLVYSLGPDTILYEGRLLNSSGLPITTTHSFRLSFWSSEDFVLGDLNGLGQINILSPAYANWQEVQSVTPNTNGTFSISLGKNTPLPFLNPLIHKYLQVEVKAFSDPDTAFELLDVNGDFGVDAIDRQKISSIPYSMSGDFSVGSLEDDFILDYENTVENSGTGEIKLTFGKNLGKFLVYDFDNSSFYFNDNLLLQGDLDVTGNSLVQGDSTIYGNVNINGTANVDGVIISGSDNVQITDALGYLDGSTLIPDSVKDKAIDFGIGVDQVDASDIPVIDNFTYSNGAEVQTVLEDLDSELENINLGSLDLTGTKQNLFTLDNDDTGGNITLQFGTTLSKQLYWDTGLSSFVFNDQVIINGDLEVNGQLNGSIIDGDLNTLQNISITSLKNRNKSIKIRPYYPNMVVSKDGDSNKITLKEGTDIINNVQYFVMTTNESTLNDVDIIVSIKIPEDFVSTQAIPFQLNVKSQSVLATDNKVDVAILDSGNAPVILSNSTDLRSTIVDTWALKDISFSGTPTFTPGTFLTFSAKLHSKNQQKIYISEIIFNYVGK